VRGFCRVRERIPQRVEHRPSPGGGRISAKQGRGVPRARGTMDAWFHNEITYPFVPDDVLDRADSVRASLPNKYSDPRVAADLFEECLDEFMLCDDVGLNVVAIEHHAGINSLLGANPLLLGILARQTRRVRILSLGTLISLRPDPVRVAEE